MPSPCPPPAARPCRALEPIVEQVAAGTDAAVAKVDVDANQQLAADYGVRGVPTMVLFADANRWRRAMKGDIPYGAGEDGTSVPSDTRVEGTRPADVLKLRLALLQVGRAGYVELIERSFDLAGAVEREVRRRPFLELAAPPGTNIVVFRCRTGGDDATIDLADRLLDECGIFLSLPRYSGRRWLRAVMLNPFTDERTVDRLFRAVDVFAGERGLR